MNLIRLEPAYQHYVWGGTRIPSYFQRKLPVEKYAESWEVSDRIEGMSIIGNGPLRGKTFREWLSIEKKMGRLKSGEKFPILVKIIDSQEHLSVQVHPDEKTAEQWGGEAKSEAWIALEKSTVYVGLQPGVTREQFIYAKETKQIESFLNQIVLEKGEAIYIPAGQIHAICADAFLLEIQQNSNTTYRLYDWERKGRQLHWEEAIRATNWEECTPHKTIPHLTQRDSHHSMAIILSTPYFIVDRLEIRDRYQLQSHAKTSQILFCTQGNATIENEQSAPGMTYLIPLSSFPISIEGSSQWISISI